MIFSVAGAAWLVAWCIQAYGANAGILFLIAAGAIALFLLSLRQFRQNQSAHAAESGSEEDKKTSRIFNIVNIVQGVAILVAWNVVVNLGHREWFVPAFIFIVGAHFIPLGLVFRTVRHYLIGAAMMLLAVLYPFIAKGGPSDPVGCLGAGILLWAFSAAVLIPA